MRETIERPVRNYKDRVFRMIFQEKKTFLELYNAMNGTDYHDPENLTVTTLDNAIYMSMKNDVSYLVNDQLTLYEHQASDNPNMPLRDLMYVSRTFRELTRNQNLFGTKLIPIPEPRFVTFYNGAKSFPERSVLKLSDAYLGKTGDPALELKVLVLNINLGCNQELMKKCRTLKDYAFFVDKVRSSSLEMPFEKAVELSIETCIQEGVLEDFLRKNRAEVRSVSIFEYDEALHLRLEREDARQEGLAEGIEEGRKAGIEEGRKEGIEEGRKEGRKEGKKEGKKEGRKDGLREGLCKGAGALIETCREFNLTAQETLERVAEKLSISESEAMEYVKQYWK